MHVDNRRVLCDPHIECRQEVQDDFPDLLRDLVLLSFDIPRTHDAEDACHPVQILVHDIDD